MADLEYIAITPSGIDTDAALVAADVAGDNFPAAADKTFKVSNGDASSHTVTVTAPSSEAVCGNFGKQSLSNIEVAIPAGESREFVIPLGYASGGKFTLTYDAVTSVTVGGFALSVNG